MPLATSVLRSARLSSVLQVYVQTGQHPAPFPSRTASLPSNLGRAAGRPALDSLPSSLFWPMHSGHWQTNLALEGYWGQVPGGHTLRDKSQQGITSNNACSTGLRAASTLPPPALGAAAMARHSPSAAGEARLCCVGEAAPALSLRPGAPSGHGAPSSPAAFSLHCAELRDPRLGLGTTPSLQPPAAPSGPPQVLG